MTDEFEGFQEPEENWSKLPHQLIGALPLIETVSEMKVILYVLRHTWGFREFDKLKRITLDEFQNGRKKKDGSRMDAGTGLSANAIKDGIARAINHGFLIQVPDGRDFGRSSHVYQLRVSNSDTVSSPDTQASKVDTQASKVDTRSEKDTCERNPGKKKDTSPSGEKLAEPVAEKTEVDPSAMPVPGDDNGASNDANRAHGAPEKGGDGAASTMTTGGAGSGNPTKSAGQRPDDGKGDDNEQEKVHVASDSGGGSGGRCDSDGVAVVGKCDYQLDSRISTGPVLADRVDYLQHCAQCAKAQQREGVWSVPAAAGGAVHWAIGPVDTFCRVLAGIDPDKLPSKKRKDWGRKLCTIAGEWQATPAVMIAAIQAIPESAIAWKMANYTSPFKDSFAEDIGAFLSNGGKVPDTLKPKGAPHGSHQRNHIAPGAVQRQVATAEEARAILGDRYGG
jgi:hypothetical protein